MNSNEKTPISIRGSVYFLEVGEVALIRHDGHLTRTSTVVSIIKTKRGFAQFETLNSIYSVETDHVPFWRRLFGRLFISKPLVSGGK